MAVSNKGSRKTVVHGAEFRWRSTGSDYGIFVAIWSKQNNASIILGRIGYHTASLPNALGGHSLGKQLVVTNRLIRQIILHYGVDFMLSNTKQIDAGWLEAIVDIVGAVHAGDE
jgi:hypothetical protein